MNIDICYSWDLAGSGYLSDEIFLQIEAPFIDM